MTSINNDGCLPLKANTMLSHIIDHPLWNQIKVSMIKKDLQKPIDNQTEAENRGRQDITKTKRKST